VVLKEVSHHGNLQLLKQLSEDQKQEEVSEQLDHSLLQVEGQEDHLEQLTLVLVEEEDCHPELPEQL